MLLRRRTVAAGLAAATLASNTTTSWAQAGEPVFGETVPLAQLDMPDIATLNQPTLQGYDEPSAQQREKAKEAIDGTQKGPTPIAIAQSFIDRYAKDDADRISQWPAPSSWNPLVKEFFNATKLKVSNDMTDWCAAFTNWCLHRNGKLFTDNAGSQSFLNSGLFAQTVTPQLGDLAVFTCYDTETMKSLGLGHVGFYAGDVGPKHFRLVAGNQSADGHRSIISNVIYTTRPVPSRRHVNGKYVPCTFKLNSFLKVPA